MAKKMLPTQIKWRRHFHQYPELSNQEYKTTDFIKKELKRRKIEVLPLDIETGLVAIIRGRGKTTAAIRTDIDALPVREKNNIPFRSRHDGCMHACGHDIHMAIALGTAAILHNLKHDLGGNVKIIFQPAEEMPPGGAAMMIKAGALKNPSVDFIFGLHVDPTLPTGKISLRDGPTFAAVVDFNLTIKGRGGHAARPHETVDAIVIASELVGSFQKIVSREIDPMNPVAITFGKIYGGVARNTVAEEVTLHGTARSFSSRDIKKLPQLIKRTANGICRSHGAICKIDFIASYPVLDNHPSANEILRESYGELFGTGAVKETPQVLGSEDFAFFLKAVPGAMFRLGIRNKKIGAVFPWHSPNFMADEEAIFYGTALLLKSILTYFDRVKK